MNETTTLLQEGLAIMLIGVSIVILFLVTMQLFMAINYRVIQKLNEIFPPEVEPTKTVKKVQKSLAKGKELIAAAIAVAHVKNN